MLFQSLFHQSLVFPLSINVFVEEPVGFLFELEVGPSVEGKLASLFETFLTAIDPADKGIFFFVDERVLLQVLG